MSASAPASPAHRACANHPNNSSVQFQPARHLSVHEYVSMSLLKDADVPTPKFGVAETAAEARKIAEELDVADLVVKAQVLAGGRGKGAFKKWGKGGVQLVYNADEVEEAAKGMIGEEKAFFL